METQTFLFFGTIIITKKTIYSLKDDKYAHLCLPPKKNKGTTDILLPNNVTTFKFTFTLLLYNTLFAMYFYLPIIIYLLLVLV